MLADAWLHDISPFVLRFSESWGLRWYGTAYALGFLLAYLILKQLARRKLTPLPFDRCGDVILTAILGVIVGGRLGYILLYEPSLFWSVTPTPPWWGVLEIQRGGMSSHGGMIGVILAAIYLRRGWRSDDGTRVGACPALHILDIFALLCPIGLFLGRIANFINGELLGRVVAFAGEPSPWWSVKFPQEVLTAHDAPRPPAVAEAFKHMVLARQIPGETWERTLQQMIDTVQSRSAEGRRLGAELAPFISARHPSQLYQAVAEGIVVGACIWWIWRSPRKPGVVGAWFLISYGVLRIATEFVRLPDAHLQVQRILGLSRGQWLSTLMVLAGVTALAIIRRSKPPAMGGWGVGRAA